MIIVKIKGGLGNQLFEYALARNLSLKTGRKLFFDLSYYKKQKFRKFNLNKFDIAPFKVIGFNFKSFFRKEFFHYKLAKMFPRLYPEFLIINESSGKKDYTNVLNVISSCYLNGYWQSEICFNNIETIIRKEFVLKEDLTGKNAELLQNINKSNSVAIHVRRDDYVSIPQNDPYNVCDLSYYNKALKIIKEKVSNPVFFVFSDDIDWAKENIKAGDKTFFIEGNESKPYIDLALYSHCKHAIMANSTFSWWATWLNSNPDKIVVAPYYYRKNAVLDSFVTNFQIRIK